MWGPKWGWGAKGDRQIRVPKKSLNPLIKFLVGGKKIQLLTNFCIRCQTGSHPPKFFLVNLDSWAVAPINGGRICIYSVCVQHRRCVCIIAMGDAPHPSLTQPHHHEETLLRTGLDKNNLRLAKGAHLGLSPELFLPPNSYNLVVCVCVYVQLYDFYSPPSLPLSRVRREREPRIYRNNQAGKGSFRLLL